MFTRNDMSAKRIWIHCLLRWIRFDFKHWPVGMKNVFGREWVICTCGYGRPKDPYRGTYEKFGK